ncbi:hypothetical protein LG047_04210 [Methylocystis sp. WRRC1]|uniref:hypothetical protein n=1 Tax=Methylocystis sp. WRRC1 TaxID=1732014 RepID=UPI001D1433EA|nr:hypothetical protein [Methylocystis sp. WRRC1]MCC3244533.1 hypothetical protein [Methylocystis sp. WRRC1]
MRGIAVLLAATNIATAAYAEADYSRVISTVTLSFENGDTDRAALVENGDAGADLYIYRGLEPARDLATPAKPALIKKDAAWSGAMWGARPSLETNAKGSLLIKSENTGIGRDRWSQTLTVVYRNKEFIVAGLTHESYDTLDPSNTHSCDLNFLTGKGKRDGKPVDFKRPAPKLADWSDEKLPKECRF